MTARITHSVVTGAARDASALVDGPAWDAAHNLSGLTGAEVAFTPPAGMSSITNQDAIVEVFTKALLLSNAKPIATSGSGSDIQSGNMGLGSLVITGGTLALSTSQAFTVTATMPASQTASQIANSIIVSTQGSAAFSNNALNVTLTGTYTGSANSTASLFSNLVAGTAGAFPAAGANPIGGNRGATLNASATTAGWNIGAQGNAGNGNVNFGLFGSAQLVKNSATNIGVAGTAINTGTSPVQIGGWFSLNQTTIPVVSAALIVDNGAQSDPIARFQVNGGDRFDISGAGQPQQFGSSGGVITTTVQANSGTYNWNLPITSGASGDFLTSAAGGASAMTWTTPATVAKSGLASDLIGTLTAWTPGLTFATPGDLAVTYATQFGRYVKLSNNMLLVQFNIQTSAFTWTTASGSLQITGLPFTAANVGFQVPRGAVSFGGINKANYTQLSLGLPINTSAFTLNASGMGQGAAAVVAADAPSGGTVLLVGEIVIFI